MVELSPSSWRGWLQTCFSLVRVSRMEPRRSMPSGGLQAGLRLPQNSLVESYLLPGQVAVLLTLVLVSAGRL